MSESRPCAKCGESTLDIAGRCSSCRAINSPFSDKPDMWLLLPERWTGEHAEARAFAAEKVEQYTSTELRSFAIAMVLLEDWNIPALTGNPDNWDFAQLDLPTVIWVGQVVMSDYRSCFLIPKNSFAPSLNGQAAQKAKKVTDGETTASS